MSEVDGGHVGGASDPDPRGAMIIEVMAFLATAEHPHQEQLVEHVARIVCRDMADSCAIAVLSADGRTLHPVGLYDCRPWMFAKLEGQPGLAWEPAGGVTERALAQGEPVLIDHADWDTLARSRPRVRRVLEWLDLGSGIVAPMRSAGTSLGVVSVGRGRASAAFANTDVPYVQTVADELALALANVRLRERMTSAAATGAGAEAEAQDIRGLTERELEILHLIGEGLTNREVGERLSLSVRTVEWHRSNLLSKLGASRRSELIAAARRLVPTAPGPN